MRLIDTVHVCNKFQERINDDSAIGMLLNQTGRLNQEIETFVGHPSSYLTITPIQLRTDNLLIDIFAVGFVHHASRTRVGDNC